MSLIKLIAELEANTVHSEKANSIISVRGVDWHIDHTLKAIIAISEALNSSNIKDYQWRFNFISEFILLTGFIPRGKGKAPKQVNEEGKIEPSVIQEQFRTVKSLITKLHHLHPKKNFDHPYFGKMNVKTSIRFLEIHTRHHLKIINDIVFLVN